MKQLIKVPFVSDVDWEDAAYNTYQTDYTVIESAIHYWSIAAEMNPSGERIRSRRYITGFATETYEDTWLTSNDVPIALNSKGTLVVANYDLDYLINHAYMLNAAAMHEIVTHVEMTIDKCPDAAVWSPAVWHAFPRTERLDRILVPF